jgi:hypothetical protein
MIKFYSYEDSKNKKRYRIMDLYPKTYFWVAAAVIQHINHETIKKYTKTFALVWHNTQICTYIHDALMATPVLSSGDAQTNVNITPESCVHTPHSPQVHTNTRNTLALTRRTFQKRHQKATLKARIFISDKRTVISRCIMRGGQTPSLTIVYKASW